MKKTILLISVIFSVVLSFSWEVQIKGGYDLTRFSYVNKKKKNYENGFIANVEYIPYDRGVFEIGLGGEYNFGNSFIYYKTPEGKYSYTAPIYLLGKVNYFRTNDNKIGIYSFTRLGYSIAGDDILAKSYKGGLYYGIGIGVEASNFVMEGLYDGQYNKNRVMHKFGLRTGLRFGNYEKHLPDIDVKSIQYFINYVPPKQDKISY